MFLVGKPKREAVGSVQGVGPAYCRMRVDSFETNLCGPFVRIMMQFRSAPYAVFIKSIMLAGQHVLPAFAGIDFKAAA